MDVVERRVFKINAEWDPEGEVWVATSDDVPGLVTEAPTVEALTEKLAVLIPELLELNGGEAGDAVPFEIVAHRQAMTAA